MSFFPKIFKSSKSRRKIKNVKSGESIQIEWSRIKGKFGWLKCINNDSKTKKILLEVSWGNYTEAKSPKKEQIILKYNDIELKNFVLLNPPKQKIDIMTSTEDTLSAVQNKVNEYLDKEEFEEALKLQNKINELLK